GFFQHFVGHRTVACSEINRAVDHLADPAATANGLVIDLNVRMQLVIFAEPLGIDGIRKGGSSSIQRGLGNCGNSKNRAHQNEHGSSHQSCDSSSIRYSGSNGAMLKEGYKRVNF